MPGVVALRVDNRKPVFTIDRSTRFLTYSKVLTMKLRLKHHSYWLSLMVLACSSDGGPSADQASTDPSGSSTSTSVAPTSGTGGAISPTVSPTSISPVGPTAGVGPVGPTGSAVSPGTTGTASGVGPSGSTAPVSPAVDPSGVNPTTDVSPTSTASSDTTSAEPVNPVNPEPDVPEPSLIVSSNNSFWQVGEVTPVDTGTPNFTVRSSTTYQKWHGWGGTFNEAGWDALKVLSAEERDRAIKLLFSKNDGLGLDWGRIPIGASDYALSRYTLSSAPGQFDISRDEENLIPYIRAAQAIKGDVKYWASPWTPPPWAKTGADGDGYDKGNFNPEFADEYADYFVSWIQAYETAGIPIDAIMPQNEAGWAQSYPTCRFGPATDSTLNMDVGVNDPRTLATFVDAHLFPKLDAAGLETNVWFGTLSNNKYDPLHWGDMKAKPSAKRIVGVGLQWETVAQVQNVLSDGYLVMQSEHKCGNYPWLDNRVNNVADANKDTFLPTLAPNNFAYGEESWDLFTQWIQLGVHVYSAWNMVLDTGGFNLDQVRKWPQNSLLVVDREKKTLTATPYYYAFRHLAQYVDVDAVRVDINGDALAFKNPDGSIVAVMRTTAAGNQIVSIDGTLLQFAATGNGWATVNWKPQ